MKSLNLYVIEDNPIHLRVLKAIIESINIANGTNHRLIALDTMDNWQQFLKRKAQYKKLPKPDLVILDMMLGAPKNWTRRDCGWDILEFIQKHKALKNLSVLVVSALSLRGCGLNDKYSNIVDMLCKPLISDGLKDCINKLSTA